MKLTKEQKLARKKEEKQRLAIAEYCGTDIYLNDVLSDIVPDYVNDLNAMHEAEKSLALPYRKEAYWLHLTEVCEPSKEYWRATAAQRAEAFLKTIGKWEE